MITIVVASRVGGRTETPIRRRMVVAAFCHVLLASLPIGMALVNEADVAGLPSLVAFSALAMLGLLLTTVSGTMAWTAVGLLWGEDEALSTPARLELGGVALGYGLGLIGIAYACWLAIWGQLPTLHHDGPPHIHLGIERVPELTLKGPSDDWTLEATSPIPATERGPVSASGYATNGVLGVSRSRAYQVGSAYPDPLFPVEPGLRWSFLKTREADETRTSGLNKDLTYKRKTRHNRTDHTIVLEAVEQPDAHGLDLVHLQRDGQPGRIVYAWEGTLFREDGTPFFRDFEDEQGRRVRSMPLLQNWGCTYGTDVAGSLELPGPRTCYYQENLADSVADAACAGCVAVMTLGLLVPDPNPEYRLLPTSSERSR